MTVHIGRRTWIADTSSLSAIRRIARIGVKGEVKVLRHLTTMTHRGDIIFPTQVVDELSARGGAEVFAPHAWAKELRKIACAKQPTFDDVARVLEDPQLSRVIDPQKPRTADEADPYILAMAVELIKSGERVTVLTEDRKDRPTKLSLASACGLILVPSVPMDAFLVRQGFIPEFPT